MCQCYTCFFHLYVWVCIPSHLCLFLCFYSGLPTAHSLDMPTNDHKCGSSGHSLIDGDQLVCREAVGNLGSCGVSGRNMPQLSPSLWWAPAVLSIARHIETSLPSLPVSSCHLFLCFLTLSCFRRIFIIGRGANLIHYHLIIRHSVGISLGFGDGAPALILHHNDKFTINVMGFLIP